MSDKLAKLVPPCQGLDTAPQDILEYFLPGGGISILAGAPNLGKTALLATILRDLQAGRPVFGRTPRRVDIGYVNTDRTWAKGAGLWLARVGIEIPYYSLADDRAFSPKRLRRKFERVDVLISFIDSLGLKRDSLVVVDPMSLFLGGNLLDYDSCACAALEIRAYLREKTYTLLGTAHSGKLKADKGERYVRTSDQILGSTAIPGFTDAVLHLASPEELGKSYYQLTWHPHGAKAEVYRLERDEQGLFLPYSGVDEVNKRRVLSCLPVQPDALSLADLVEQAQQFPLSQRTVQRVLEALIDDGLVEKAGYGKYRKILVC